jgi:hypothetical protein
MTQESKIGNSVSHWYSVLAVFEAAPCEDYAQWDPVFELRIMLLRAGSHDEAMNKGGQLGRDEEQEYTNNLNQRVCLRFREILDVRCLSWINEFTDGTETYYRYVGAEGLAEIKRALNRTFPEDVTPTSQRKT